MNRTLTILIALAVLAGGIVPVVGAAQSAGAPTAADEVAIHAQMENTTQNGTEEPTQSDTETTTAPETDENDSEAVNETVPPGARLAGTIGVQQAEIDGALQERSFGLQMAANSTNQSRAEVLAMNQERLQDRLDAVKERKQTLEQARENESISEARYKAEATSLAVHTANVHNLANRSTQIAQGMPADVLEENGVNVTAMQQIRSNASNMTGPETARFARSIAGNSVGQPLGPPEAVPRGPSEEMPGSSREGVKGVHSGNMATGNTSATDGGNASGALQGTMMTTTPGGTATDSQMTQTTTVETTEERTTETTTQSGSDETSGMS